jgi:hypothetical protein
MSDDPGVDPETLHTDHRSTVAGLGTGVQDGAVNLIMSDAPTVLREPTANALLASIATTEYRLRMPSAERDIGPPHVVPERRIATGFVPIASPTAHASVGLIIEMERRLAAGRAPVYEIQVAPSQEKTTPRRGPVFPPTAYPPKGVAVFERTCTEYSVTAISGVAFVVQDPPAPHLPLQ